MMCYRDKTFCPFHETCQFGKECGRALTEDVKYHALANQLPVCQFVEKPNCYLEKSNEGN